MNSSFFSTVLATALLLASVAANARTFSEEAWADIAPLYKQIVAHPFNAELAKGTLAPEKFAYFEEQDALYLQGFGKALALLAAKLTEPADVELVLALAKDSLRGEGKPLDKKRKSPELAPFTFTYVNFLLVVAAYESREELAAALLPCYWIYQQVAEDLAAKSPADNRYRAWLTTYSSKSYRDSVQSFLTLVDRLADDASPARRLSMLQRFRRATQLEWSFWEGSYRLEKWRRE